MLLRLTAVRVTEECELERRQRERQDEWKQKALHGQFVPQTIQILQILRGHGCG